MNVQEMIEHAIKDSKNPHFKSNYASLESVLDTAKPALIKAKIFLMQASETREHGYILITRLQHESGEFYEFESPLLMPKQDMQTLGASITYQRRFSACAILGFAQTDDDGNVASNKAQGKPVSGKPFLMGDVEFQKIKELREQLQISQQQVTDHCVAITGKGVKELNLDEYNAFISALKAWGKNS